MDWLGGLPEVLAHIEEFKLVQKAQPGMSGVQVYGMLKQDLYKETIDYLEATTEDSVRRSVKTLQWQREHRERRELVQAWERSRAKL